MDLMIKKWSPIITDLFEFKNEYLINTICIFCEHYHLNRNQYELISKLKEIKKRLYDIESIEVSKSYYNPVTGLVTHKLINGLVVDQNFHIRDMDQEKFISIFGEIGLEIIRESNKPEFRNLRIMRILD